MKCTEIDDRPTCGGFFAGIGGFCVGFERAGFKTEWCLDLSEEAAVTYKANFPDVQYFIRDITGIKGSELKPVDVLHAGFPCQSFSGAGYRMGFDDPRGQLFFEIPRLLKEWGNHRPKVVVLENSPHLKDGGSGVWFKTVQVEIQRAGYWFSAANTFILDAREHGGLPQRRKRLFMVAVRDDLYDHNGISLNAVAPQQRVELSDILTKEDVDESYYLPSDNKYNQLIKQSVSSDDPYQVYQLRKYIVRVPESGVCPTLTANMGLGGHNVPFVFHNRKLRKLTEYECLMLQGFPPEFKFPDAVKRNKRYVLVGNAVSPAVSGVIAARIKSFLCKEVYR